MITRSTRRISRELLIGLSAVLMLALVFGAYNLGKGNGAAQAEKGDRKAIASIPIEADPIKPPAPSAPPVAPATQAAASQPAAPLLGAVTDQPTVAGATTRPSDSAQTARHAAANNSRGAGAPALSSSNPLAEAKALIDEGHLLDARRLLNSAVVSGSLSDDDTHLAKQTLNDINEVIVFSTKRFADDELGGTFTVPPGGVLEKIARSHEVSADLLMRLNGITDPRRLQAGQAIKVLKGPFNAVVDKSDFTLELWVGEPGTKSGVYVTSFPVGLGADDSTPTGVWAVQTKLKNPAYYSPRGEGVIDADDPKNPLGECWIGLVGTDGHAVGKTSYGIHGTIEPDSIGKQASMGCIRLTNENIARVYELLKEGKSTVTVRE